MKYTHDTIQVETPAPGHYLISGHNPRPVLTPEGHLVPPGTVHITPEVPSGLLFAILRDRGDYPPLLTIEAGQEGSSVVTGGEALPESAHRPAVPGPLEASAIAATVAAEKNRGGRPRKHRHEEEGK